MIFYFSDSGISLSRIFVKLGQLGGGGVGSSGKMREGRVSDTQAFFFSFFFRDANIRGA